MLSRGLRTRRRMLNGSDTVRPGDGTTAETARMTMAERNDELCRAAELAGKRQKRQPSGSTLA
jgi:hypothetical protein